MIVYLENLLFDFYFDWISRLVLLFVTYDPSIIIFYYEMVMIDLIEFCYLYVIFIILVDLKT